MGFKKAFTKAIGGEGEVWAFGLVGQASQPGRKSFLFSLLLVVGPIHSFAVYWADINEMGEMGFGTLSGHGSRRK